MDDRDLGCLIFAMGIGTLIAAAIAFLIFTQLVDIVIQLD